MQYFGAPGSAKVYRIVDQVPTPVGDKCAHCDRPIRPGDRGFMVKVSDTAPGRPVHRGCVARLIAPVDE